MSKLNKAVAEFLECGGLTGKRIKVNEDRWLLRVPDSNPTMTEMFYLREILKRPGMVPWYGEFPGKFITGAVLCWKITKNEQLLSVIQRIVDELEASQDADGYLGCYPYNQRIIGCNNGTAQKLWDLWGHYHCMLGLFIYYKETGSSRALHICEKAADYICSLFLDKGVDITQAGELDKNLSISHFYCLFYQETNNPRYIEMVRYVEEAWKSSQAGDYMGASQEGLEFYQMKNPRWESLHNIQAIGELYRITKDKKYYDAFKHVWRSICKYDRHNSGGFSSGEQAKGDPYDMDSIETCCTIAWMALTLDMLYMDGDSYVADEFELSYFNALLGSQHPSGSWWTYNTPMEGVRKSSSQDIVFQSYQGSPEINCCSMNGPRGLGMLSEFAVMAGEDGNPVINYYGLSRIKYTFPSGQILIINQVTDYPLSGNIEFTISISENACFSIWLRIPVWSHKTVIRLNGAVIDPPFPGQYLEMQRCWHNGDVIELELDMTLHFWKGEHELKDRVSIYRGPLLLAYDQRYNDFQEEKTPEISLEELGDYSKIVFCRSHKPELLLEFKSSGNRLRLCDFASAGIAGTHYTTWLRLKSERTGNMVRSSVPWNARTQE